MPAPVLSTVTNTSTSLTFSFDADVSYTADVGSGLSLLVDGSSHTIRSATATADGGVLEIDPVYVGQTVLLSLDNTTSPYAFDAATGLDAATSFTDSPSVNNSAALIAPTLLSAVYVPTPKSMSGTLFGQVEVELCRYDRGLVRKLGPYSVDTAYTWTDTETITIAGSPTLVRDGSVITASVDINDLGQAYNAVIAWQQQVRNNIVFEIVKRRTAYEGLSLPGEVIYGV